MENKRIIKITRRLFWLDYLHHNKYIVCINQNMVGILEAGESLSYETDQNMNIVHIEFINAGDLELTLESNDYKVVLEENQSIHLEIIYPFKYLLFVYLSTLIFLFHFIIVFFNMSFIISFIFFLLFFLYLRFTYFLDPENMIYIQEMKHIDK